MKRHISEILKPGAKLNSNLADLSPAEQKKVKEMIERTIEQQKWIPQSTRYPFWK